MSSVYFSYVHIITCLSTQCLQDKKHNKLLVAAIDFGTTYSGYAYMMKSDFLENKGDNSKINCPTWIREGGMSYKAPTTVLFRPNKTFHSFGFDAEKFYHDNSDSLDFKEWYFFKHFKMKLYEDKVFVLLFIFINKMEKLAVNTYCY